MSSAEFSTVILRFRDLATAPNETIRLHMEIIDSQGFVWWGWWSKQGEKIPDDAFRQLRETAIQPAGLQLFLMDSGTGRVYKVTCSDLNWDISHERTLSPDINATPGYYRDQEYFAWFKFKLIEPVDAAVLHDFSYVRVDEFFQTGESRYVPFYTKRVHSVDELPGSNNLVCSTLPRFGSDTRGVFFRSASNYALALPSEFHSIAQSQLVVLLFIKL